MRQFGCPPCGSYGSRHAPREPWRRVFAFVTGAVGNPCVMLHDRLMPVGSLQREVGTINSAADLLRLISR